MQNGSQGRTSTGNKELGQEKGKEKESNERKTDNGSHGRTRKGRRELGKKKVKENES